MFIICLYFILLLGVLFCGLGFICSSVGCLLFTIDLVGWLLLYLIICCGFNFVLNLFSCLVGRLLLVLWFCLVVVFVSCCVFSDLLFGFIVCCLFCGFVVCLLAWFSLVGFGIVIELVLFCYYVD